MRHAVFASCLALMFGCGSDSKPGAGGAAGGGTGAVGAGGSGGSSGASGSAGVGGAVATGGASGAAGTRGVGGASGAGGAAGSCAAPDAAEPILYTTFDDASAITNPAIGLAGSGTGAVDFVAGVCGSAAEFVHDHHGLEFEVPTTYFDRGSVDLLFAPVDGCPTGATLSQRVLVQKGPPTPRFSLSLFASPGQPWQLRGNYVFDAATNVHVAIPFHCTPGVWTRITMTWDVATTPTVKLYLDGALQGTADGASGANTSSAPSSTIRVGAASGNPAHGRIDEFRLYDVVLEP